MSKITAVGFIVPKDTKAYQKQQAADGGLLRINKLVAYNYFNANTAFISNLSLIFLKSTPEATPPIPSLATALDK